jgi:hypothetical protein
MFTVPPRLQSSFTLSALRENLKNSWIYRIFD